MKLNLETVAALRINQEKETVTVYPMADEPEYTIDIVDINWIDNDIFSPVFQLKLTLSFENWKLSGGWLYLNQTGVWEAANPEL